MENSIYHSKITYNCLRQLNSLVCMTKRCYNAHKHKFLHLKPFGFRQDSMSPVLSDVFQNSMLKFSQQPILQQYYCGNRQECLKRLLSEQKRFSARQEAERVLAGAEIE